MIQMRLIGRLGNQLFTYAFARNIIDKCPDQTIELLIFEEKSNYGVTECRLDNYPLHQNIKIVRTDKRYIPGKGLIKIAYLGTRWISLKIGSEKGHRLEKFMDVILKRGGIYLCSDGYRNPDWIYQSKLNKTIFCRGYFQSEKYFWEIENILKKELKPKKEICLDAIDMIKKIRMESNPVCISVRLGDYLKFKTLNVCGEDYYLRAINYIRHRLPDSTFYLFSDDVENAKKLFDKKMKVIAEPGNWEDYEKLFVMSECQHFIIANSTFSWWAQYLCTNPDKIVVAPQKWFNGNMHCEIYQNNWIRI